MEYGALDYASARQDAYLLTALSRRLFHDVYVVQKIDLATQHPLPQHDIALPGLSTGPVVRAADVIVHPCPSGHGGKHDEAGRHLLGRAAPVGPSRAERRGWPRPRSWSTTAGSIDTSCPFTLSGARPDL
jgi:hypothetical protein